MRAFILFIILSTSFNSLAQTKVTEVILRCSPKDSAMVMEKTKTIIPCNYMSKEEKKTVQWLNIARMYPKWYIYFNKLGPSTDTFKNGLYKTLNKMQPITTKLIPDSTLWYSAQCHAKYTGNTGFLGHDRKNSDCKKNYLAECIHYGSCYPHYVIIGLLTDQGVKGLGHREICLDPMYKKVGVSIKTHKSKYRQTAVLDFK